MRVITYQKNSPSNVSAASRGLEPPAYALGKRRSIQMSYEAMKRDCLERGTGGLIDRFRAAEGSTTSNLGLRVLVHYEHGNEGADFRNAYLGFRAH